MDILSKVDNLTTGAQKSQITYDGTPGVVSLSDPESIVAWELLTNELFKYGKFEFPFRPCIKDENVERLSG